MVSEGPSIRHHSIDPTRTYTEYEREENDFTRSAGTSSTKGGRSGGKDLELICEWPKQCYSMAVPAGQGLVSCSRDEVGLTSET